MIKNSLLLTCCGLLSAPVFAQINREEAKIDSLIKSANEQSLPFVVGEAASVEAYRQAVGASSSYLEESDIRKVYFGQDMPMLLQNQPSVVSYSDGGNYNGYSYMRLRGMDQTRINVTLNGVPLSEPEDQGVYFSNFTDFANNIETMQLLRGVHISNNGTAAFAGAMSFQSPNVVRNFSLGNMQLGYGSFGSRRISAGYNSGLLPNRFACYGRFTNSANRGYREHSGNNSSSFFGSIAYVPSRKHVFKLVGFSGNARNDMAYLATNLSDIKTNPRRNYLNRNEKDDFTQNFLQLLHSWQGNEESWRGVEHWEGNNSIYYITIDGNYDLYAAPNMFNLNLKSQHFGFYSNAKYSRRLPFGYLRNWSATAGLHGSSFFRHHYLGLKPLVSAADALYFNTGFKREGNGFLSLYSYSSDYKLNLQLDVQGRVSNFTYQADKDYNLANLGKTWAFFNYRAAASYKIHDRVLVSSSLGSCRREPTRTDLLGNYDDIDSSNIAQIGNFNRVKPEQVLDWETGLSARVFRKIYTNLSIYSLWFRNEIAPIGQLNSFGIPLRQNIARSHRAGVEWMVRFNLPKNLSTKLLVGLHRHRIKEYTTAYNGQTYRNVSHLLVPTVQAGLELGYTLSSKLEFQLSSRYVGKSFLSNENDPNFTLPAYFVADLRVNYQPIAGHMFSFSANNLTNKSYFSAGYVNGSEAAYYVQAPFNFFILYNLYF